MFSMSAWIRVVDVSGDQDAGSLRPLVVPDRLGKCLLPHLGSTEALGMESASTRTGLPRNEIFPHLLGRGGNLEDISVLEIQARHYKEGKGRTSPDAGRVR